MKNNTELLNNLGNFINRALVFIENNFSRSAGTNAKKFIIVQPYLPSFSYTSTIPEMDITEEDFEVIARVTRELLGYISCLENLRWVYWGVNIFVMELALDYTCVSHTPRLRDGLKHILSISRLGNGHIQANMPWKLVKGSPQEM